MPMYFPPWDSDNEPNESNIKIWMDNIYGKFEPMEQARWNQANIDTLFVAGEQRFINSYFNFFPNYNSQSFFFNFIQQPINMVTGYQRQHRKSIGYVPIEGNRQEFADDLTNVVTYANTYRNILEKFSTACEQAATSGLVLVQPYLDYTDDPVNGTMDLKVWSYNSFMTDPFWREPDMSDCNVIWCQEYISKGEAIERFPHQEDIIRTMSGYGNRYGKFYFLPENYNLSRNDLLVLSYVWFKSKRKKKMLYNRNDGISYEFTENDEQLEELIRSTDFFEVIEIDVPTWKLASVINEQLMYLNHNPMGFDECPFVPVFWNRDPHISQYDLRTRSLTRSMRDAQFLLNRRVILNHDISESSINTGYIRKENSVANEDELKRAGQGIDIIMKEGYELTDIQKIIPNAVPPSDLQLADQLVDFIFRVSGVNQELLGMSQDSETGIQEMLRQGAGLVTLQKYFDQWDVSLKLLGKLEQKIIQNKWSPTKIARILGKEPNAEFLNKTFSRYDVLVQEGANTTIQKQQEFRQILELNNFLGGIIPAKFILERATIQGKNEIIEAIEQQQQQQAEMAQQEQMLKQAVLESQLQVNQSKSISDIALAHERHGRAESNVGLFEERLSEITQNRSMALKNKVEALQKLMEIVGLYGESNTAKKASEIETYGDLQKIEEDTEKAEAHATSESNKFITSLMQINQGQGNMQKSNFKEQLL